MPKCPCCSGKEFSQCCSPVIQQQSAPTALALMRSRYTAHQLAHVDYLYDTIHSKNRKRYSKTEIEKWAKESSWQKLEIISVEHGKLHDRRGIVEFKAYFRDVQGKDHVHHERSNFLKDNGQWFYVDGTLNPKATQLQKKVSRNDPCPCGSGLKYKKCCGK